MLAADWGCELGGNSIAIGGEQNVLDWRPDRVHQVGGLEDLMSAGRLGCVKGEGDAAAADLDGKNVQWRGRAGGENLLHFGRAKGTTPRGDLIDGATEPTDRDRAQETANRDG